MSPMRSVSLVGGHTPPVYGHTIPFEQRLDPPRHQEAMPGEGSMQLLATTFPAVSSQR